MKQSRKLGNLVAEELQDAMTAKGITFDDATFEGHVSSIVDLVSEAVEGCVKKKDEEDEIIEGVDVAEVYMATEDTTLGNVNVAAGEFVEIDEIDADTDAVYITVYDEDGEVKAEEVAVDFDVISDFSDVAEIVEFDDEDDDDMDEGVHIRNGKKVKFSAAKEKLRAKLAAKKGNGVNKFTVKDGKIVKKSAAQLKADKKRSKTFGKRMKRFAKKRAKSLRKAAKLNSGAESGSMKVVEGFDVTSDNMKFALEEGDIINVIDGAMTVVREGKDIVSGIAVCEEFMERCLSEGVVESCGTCKDDEDGKKKTDEAAILTFKGGTGYVYIKEGSEVPLGNRIRARAFLTNEGVDVTAEILDKAANGELVTL